MRFFPFMLRLPLNVDLIPGLSRKVLFTNYTAVQMEQKDVFDLLDHPVEQVSPQNQCRLQR